MESKNNIFYATNPARMMDALWRVMDSSGVAMADMLIFLPSRRAVRAVEKMLAEKCGGAAVLPRLVALGEGADEFDDDTLCDEIRGADIITNTERIILATKLLAADANIGSYAAALPLARDLVRMTDYLENEGVDIGALDWSATIDEKYAAHFQGKAKILNIIGRLVSGAFDGRETVTARRNADIRAWAQYFNAPDFPYGLIIVCSSTASVPATADLMTAVANDARGRIILPGKICGAPNDLARVTNPYNSEYRFLTRLGISPDDVRAIDVGPSAIDFMNAAFSNDVAVMPNAAAVSHCHLVECPRESVEAACAARIAEAALAQNKSVLIITPDAAGNQRIANALAVRGLSADFSGATPATMTCVGRAILNVFDDWIEVGGGDFSALYRAAGGDLFEMISRMVSGDADKMAPAFDPVDEVSVEVWRAIKEMSDALVAVDIVPTVTDARAFLADAIGSVSVRGEMKDEKIVVLGTIESRMQTADVVIMTGLNDGMFPARGYENAWIPRAAAEKIGLPPGDRKVSLMSLDFMNLSCGADVWWLRSLSAGNVQTTESRFLSRVCARHGAFDRCAAADILAAVAARDEVERRALDYSAPTPPADWSDVYVTELELLIHNPYAFYARHILRLKPKDPYWAGVDARNFGDVVHHVIEKLTPDVPAAGIVERLDAAARAELGMRETGVLFYFWHRRFVEIAPLIATEMARLHDAAAELDGRVRIANRTVRARADRVWNGGVMDIKTGTAPRESVLAEGNMPQLPLEAYMLQQGGFHGYTCRTPVIEFLQLASASARIIRYDAETTQKMINAAVDKVTGLINRFSSGGAPYENVPVSDEKYRRYDELARVFDD